jgi:hypothetical protein
MSDDQRESEITVAETFPTADAARARLRALLPAAVPIVAVSDQFTELDTWRNAMTPVLSCSTRHRPDLADDQRKRATGARSADN